MKIYDFALSPNCRKVRAVVYELGLTPEFLPVHIFKSEQHRPEVTALNANERVPILVDGDFVLWESNAIAAYLAHGTPLLPSSARERADVDRWSAWQLSHFGPAVGKVAFQRWVKPMTGKGQPDPAIVEEGTAEYTKLMGVLEASLGNKEYVAGRLSIADFILASIFSIATTVGLETSSFPKAHAWLERVMARESMKRALSQAREAMPR